MYARALFVNRSGVVILSISGAKYSKSIVAIDLIASISVGYCLGASALSGASDGAECQVFVPIFLIIYIVVFLIALADGAMRGGDIIGGIFVYVLSGILVYVIGGVYLAHEQKLGHALRLLGLAWISCHLFHYSARVFLFSHAARDGG